MLELKLDLWQLGANDIKYVTRWLNMIADDKQAVALANAKQQAEAVLAAQKPSMSPVVPEVSQPKETANEA